jgi:hypothetical protein
VDGDELDVGGGVGATVVMAGVVPVVAAPVVVDAAVAVVVVAPAGF